MHTKGLIQRARIRVNNVRSRVIFFERLLLENEIGRENHYPLTRSNFLKFPTVSRFKEFENLSVTGKIEFFRSLPGKDNFFSL